MARIVLRKGQWTCDALNSQGSIDKIYSQWVSLVVTFAWRDNVNIVCYLTEDSTNLRTWDVSSYVGDYQVLLLQNLQFMNFFSLFKDLDFLIKTPTIHFRNYQGKAWPEEKIKTRCWVIHKKPLSSNEEM